MSETLKIAIVNTMPFPSGEASVNRILSYSKGLVGYGCDVTVLTTSVGDVDKYQFIDGIRYRHTRKPSSGIFARFEFMGALWRTIRLLATERPKYQVLIVVSNSLLLIYPLWLTCRLCGIKIVQEKGEYPFVLNKKSFLGRLYARFYVNTTYKLFDGLIIITHILADYFKDKVSRRCRILIMPMTVDTSRFENCAASDVPGDYIAYCGDVGGNKDGVQNLVEAFSYVQSQYPDVKLLLIGGSLEAGALDKLKEYVKRRQISNVIFYGKVAREKIPPLLQGAKVLALARPSSLQSQGGFPTKLGEYLATGNPVVITRVGEIPMYLNDSNAFTVEPDDNVAFANRIMDVLGNYKAACQIGRQGRKLATSVFDYRAQSYNLMLYLKEMCR